MQRSVKLWREMSLRSYEIMAEIKTALHQAGKYAAFIEIYEVPPPAQPSQRKVIWWAECSGAVASVDGER